jgi:hypothetical protein
MSTAILTLNDVVRGNLGEGDEMEMRPDRIGGGKLISFSAVVQTDGERQLPAPAGCLGQCTHTSRASSHVAGKLGTAATKRFLRWLADSLDTDTPMVNLEVVSDNGDTETVEAPARRLAKVVFG